MTEENIRESNPPKQISDYADFPWPSADKSFNRPVWTGNGFDVGGVRRDILCYDQHESHWSPALTAMHEADAGRDHPIDLASRRMAVQSLRRYVSSPNPFVLDVGCSSGFFLDTLRAECPNARLIGADFLPEPLHALAARLPDVPILQFDLTTCPLPDACLDGVTALNVLEHIKDDVQALAQIRRILKPGGLVHIEVPCNPNLYDIYDEQLLHHRRYHFREIAGKMQQAGFEIVRGTHLGFLAYPLFAMVKRRNRGKNAWAKERKQEYVSSQIRRTRRSPGMQAVMALELNLGRWVSYPIGIRCVIAGKRRP